MSTLLIHPTQSAKSFRPAFSPNTASLTELSRGRHSVHDALEPHEKGESCQPKIPHYAVDAPAVQRGIRILDPTVPRISGRLNKSYSPRQSRIANSEPRWDSATYYVVRLNERDCPCVSFFPHDGLGVGVAMGLAFYQEGMLMKQSSIEFCLPPTLRGIESLPFTLRWPGYTHIVVRQNIFLIDPDTGCHVTYCKIAQQVAQMFSEFIQHFSDDFDGSDSGIRLGPKAVTFHNLRLHQVYIRDGRSLDAEVSYTRRN